MIGQARTSSDSGTALNLGGLPACTRECHIYCENYLLSYSGLWNGDPTHF
jgi:hypothetical protein